MHRIGTRVRRQQDGEFVGETGTVIATEFDDRGRFRNMTVRLDDGRLLKLKVNGNEEYEHEELDPYAYEDCTPLTFVNVYHVEQRYGGPEEGGWWYTAGVPVTEMCKQCGSEEDSREYSKVMMKKVEAINAEEHPYGLHSVLSNGILDVKQEAWPARSFPHNRPHYE